MDTQVMLILILIDAQHSQKAVFSFEKGSNCQNHSSDFLHPITLPVKFVIPLTGENSPPPPLTTIWKTLMYWVMFYTIEYLVFTVKDCYLCFIKKVFSQKRIWHVYLSFRGVMWFSISREGGTCHIVGSLRCVRCWG